MVKRVRYSELEHDDNDVHDLGGERFTGIAVHSGAEFDAEVEYRMGVPWGISRKHSKAGVLIEEGSYLSGFGWGLWRTWDPDGRLASEEQREYGFPLTRKRWDSDGNLVEDFVLHESDARFRTLTLFRQRHGQCEGLSSHAAAAGEATAEPLSWPTDFNKNEDPGSG